MKINDWFKPAMVFLVIIFLFILWQYSENGRYIYYAGHRVSDLGVVIDSRTGTVYGLLGVEKDSRTGTVYVLDSGKAFKAEFPYGKFSSAPVRQK